MLIIKYFWKKILTLIFILILLPWIKIHGLTTAYIKSCFMYFTIFIITATLYPLIRPKIMTDHDMLLEKWFLCQFIAALVESIAWPYFTINFRIHPISFSPYLKVIIQVYISFKFLVPFTKFTYAWSKFGKKKILIN